MFEALCNSSIYFFPRQHHVAIPSNPSSNAPAMSPDSAEKKTVVNKFTRENPPASSIKYFKQLGFDPIHYVIGPNKGEFRKTIKQVYGFCQRFISGLSKETLYHFRHPGRSARPDNSVVDRELIKFLRLRGDKLFGASSYNKQSNSKLITFNSANNDEK